MHFNKLFFLYLEPIKFFWNDNEKRTLTNNILKWSNDKSAMNLDKSNLNMNYNENYLGPPLLSRIDGQPSLTKISSNTNNDIAAVHVEQTLNNK